MPTAIRPSSPQDPRSCRIQKKGRRGCPAPRRLRLDDLCLASPSPHRCRAAAPHDQQRSIRTAPLASVPPNTSSWRPAPSRRPPSALSLRKMSKKVAVGRVGLSAGISLPSPRVRSLGQASIKTPSTLRVGGPGARCRGRPSPLAKARDHTQRCPATGATAPKKRAHCAQIGLALRRTMLPSRDRPYGRRPCLHDPRVPRRCPRPAGAQPTLDDLPQTCFGISQPRHGVSPGCGSYGLECVSWHGKDTFLGQILYGDERAGTDRLQHFPLSWFLQHQ